MEMAQGKYPLSYHILLPFLLTHPIFSLTLLQLLLLLLFLLLLLTPVILMSSRPVLTVLMRLMLPPMKAHSPVLLTQAMVERKKLKVMA